MPDPQEPIPAAAQGDEPRDESESALVFGRDYTVDPGGAWVFTAAYLLSRGSCCGSGCRHCPYPPEATGERPA